MEKVEVLRHSVAVRILHWFVFITGILLALTGMELGGLYGVRIFGEQTLRIHILIGFIFGGIWWLFAAYMCTKEWKWISITRIPYSVKYLVLETLAWFKLYPHVEDPRGYNPDKEEYVEKIIPTQVIVWWTYLVLIIIIGLTGLAMYYPDVFKPIVDFAAALGSYFNPAGVCDGYTALRAIHRICMYLIGMVMFMHIYAVIVYEVLISMFTGKRKERVVKE